VYCDRKREVCSAMGAVREGNRLAVHAPARGIGLAASAAVNSAAPPAAGAGGGSTPTAVGRWQVQWYRSAQPAPAYVAFQRQLAAEVAAGHIGPHGTLQHTATDGATVAAADIALTIGEPFTEAALPADVCAACRDPVTGDSPASFLMLPLARRDPAAVFPLPPVPGLRVPDDADPAAACAELEAAYHLAVSAHDGFPNDSSPLYSAAAALRLMRAEALSAEADPSTHYLTLDDVGHLFAAVLTDAETGTRVRSGLIGPVEAAPPRMRDLWLEGSPVAGQSLVARGWYYGGLPGPCEYSWIRVDAEGNRSETLPVPQAPLAALDAATSGAGDPRFRRLAAQDVGCMFKVTCDPVRLDGAKGAPTTSKPSQEVAAPELHAASSRQAIEFAPAPPRTRP